MNYAQLKPSCSPHMATAAAGSQTYQAVVSGMTIEGPPRYYMELLPRLNSVSVCIEMAREDLYSISGVLPAEAEVPPYLLLNGIHRLAFPPGLQTDLLPSSTSREIDLLKLVTNTDKTCVSLRLSLQLLGMVSKSSAERTIETLTNTNHKWSSGYLNQLKQQETLQMAKFTCKECSACVIPVYEIRKFNDMPSEIWAEMMEFWHCHKPASEHGAESSPINRYTVLKPGKSSIISGSYYFLLNLDDEYTKKSCITRDKQVLCQNCDAELGEIDKDNVMKVFKWCLKLELNDENEDIFYSFIHAYSSLLDSVSSTAFRKYLIKSDTQTEDNKKSDTKNYRGLIWVFNFGINVSTGSGIYDKCLKIMYTQDEDTITEFLQKRSQQANGDGSIQGISNEIDVLHYPDAVIDDMFECLNMINTNMPCFSQELDFWKIGYLPCDL